MDEKKSGVTIYTMSDCIFCDVIKARLIHEGIPYDEITDPFVIAGKGYTTVPHIETGDISMNFDDSIKWLNANRSQ